MQTPMPEATDGSQGLYDWAVVIPSIRQIRLEMLEAIPEQIPIYVVDDSNGNIVANRANMRVFYYADQEKMLGSNSTLVPRKSAACRNFAYYYIWKETDHSHIVTLDDDCHTHAGFLEQHSVVGTSQEWLTYSSLTEWMNSIELLPVPRADLLFARGYPYWGRDEPAEYQLSRVRGHAVCNLGLWSHHLDFDGVDKYVVDRYQELYDFDPAQVSTVRVGTPSSPTFIPFSGMNVAFERSMLPIVTQVPMNQQLGQDYFLWRFDDIWSGVLIQTLINKKPEDCLTAGGPIVKHTRAGNLKREVLGEHYGHLISPYFYEIVQEAAEKVSGTSYLEMYIELCGLCYETTSRKREAGKLPKMYAGILLGLFDHLSRWSSLFR